MPVVISDENEEFFDDIRREWEAEKKQLEVRKAKEDRSRPCPKSRAVGSALDLVPFPPLPKQTEVVDKFKARALDKKGEEKWFFRPEITPEVVESYAMEIEFNFNRFGYEWKKKMEVKGVRARWEIEEIDLMLRRDLTDREKEQLKQQQIAFAIDDFREQIRSECKAELEALIVHSGSYRTPRVPKRWEVVQFMKYYLHFNQFHRRLDKTDTGEKDANGNPIMLAAKLKSAWVRNYHDKPGEEHPVFESKLAEAKEVLMKMRQHLKPFRNSLPCKFYGPLREYEYPERKPKENEDKKQKGEEQVEKQEEIGIKRKSSGVMKSSNKTKYARR